MKKLISQDAERKSLDIVAGNIAQLKTIFPEACTDEKVDFDVMRQLLGAAVDEREERYGLNWHGKRHARQLALTPSAATLRPCPEESVDWETTRNLVIEGDNLEVLKLLQKSYAGEVKLIYIDPPYNTGRNFIYPDNFQDNIRSYLRLTGQIDGSGSKILSDAEASGRFHTDWLNMMYPRLKLARNLLREDGVIFISIDDNELDNLVKVCRELFGEENYCGAFVWEKKKKPSFLSANMGSVTDYIVCFAKRREASPPFTVGAVEDGKKYPFNNAGNCVRTLTFPAGSVTFTCSDQIVNAQDMSEGNIKTTLLDDVEIRNGRNTNAFRLRGEWRYSQKKLDEFVAQKAAIVINKVPFRPNYVNRSGDPKKTTNLLSYRTNGVPTNEDATEELRELFGADVMSHPKPSGLLKYLVRSVTGDGDLVLDFFAGSGTTAHGLWLADVESNIRRRFILVQLPEPTRTLRTGGVWETTPAWESGFRTIAELTRERLQRAARKIREENQMAASDLGFRAFKLESINIREWEPNRDDTTKTLQGSTEQLTADRSEQDMLFELLLKFGFDLAVPIEQKVVAGKIVYRIGSGILLVCLAEYIGGDEVESLAQGIISWYRELTPERETTVIFRDSAFAEEVAKMSLSAILHRHGLEHVRSL